MNDVIIKELKPIQEIVLTKLNGDVIAEIPIFYLTEESRNIDEVDTITFTIPLRYRDNFSKKMVNYYVYDEAHLMLIGERTKNIYRLGDAVKVRCSRVDIDNREIFFDIVKNEGEKEEIVPSKRTASIIAEIKKEFGPKEEGQKEEDEGM